MGAIEELVRSRIRREGSLRFDRVMELALYDEADGFFATARDAGRRGDFLTSPEVGPLFGAVVAIALDRWWDELGRPDPYVVVEAGAGRGALALAVRRAAPRCLPALTYVLVERSPGLRQRQDEHLPIEAPHFGLLPPTDDDLDDDGPAGQDGHAGGLPPGLGSGPRFVSLEDLPAVRSVGVVLANELLDNLAFRVIRRDADGVSELHAIGADGPLEERFVPLDPTDTAAVPPAIGDLPIGAVVPMQPAAVAWVRRALACLDRGRLVVIDYAAATAELASRPERGWLRTYRGHARGGPPFHDLGGQDITADLALDQLTSAVPPAGISTQADFLRRHGIDELVAEGKALWEARAGVGDLAAVAARSRIGESAALLDPAGLGAFTVLEWTVGA